MEEQFFEIIKEYEHDWTYPDDPERTIAKKITAHVMEFLGWIRETDSETLHVKGLYTNTEVYQYWLTEIKPYIK